MTRSTTPAGGAARSSQPPPRNKAKSQPVRKQRKDKGISLNPAPLRDEENEEEVEYTTAPWPREDNAPFIGAGIPLIYDMTPTKMRRLYAYANRKYGDAWKTFNSVFYNGLLCINFQPTKFVCARTLEKMGIKDDIERMLIKMGLGTLATKPYPLYPELARQFLASVEVHYPNAEAPRASTGVLTYLCRGKLYEISIREMCELYGFNKLREECSIPSYEKSPHLHKLWNLIGSGDCITRENKLSLIRNPAVRVVSKIIGHNLFGKEEAGALRGDECVLIHHGLPSFVHDIYDQTIPPIPPFETNLGAVFAAMLVQKKFRYLAPSPKAKTKVEIIGNLLTPIFRFHDIDITGTECIDTLALFDEDYFKHTFILRPKYKYQFYDRDGVTKHCQLPAPTITSLTSIENVEFLPSDDLLCTVVPRQRPRTSFTRASTSQPHQEDDSEPHTFEHYDAFASQQPTMDQPLPDYTGEYDLSPIADDASDRDRMDWLIKSTKKNNSMMKKIWRAVSRPRCPPTPSCFRAADTTETDEGMTDPVAADTDVAGHETTEDEDAGDLVPRSRRRRKQGESRSGTSASDES